MGMIIFYFASAFALFILGLIFSVSFENIWLTAIPVTIIAGLLLIIAYLWSKRKK